MKCPDCDTRLSEVKLEGDTWVYRCFKCGGFWLDSWTANRLSNKTLASWRRIGLSEMWRSGGKGMCPQDGMMLERYRGESIPPNLAVSRCRRCGKWWFPGDTLFEYKPAAEAKISYYSRWGLTGDLTGLALPILSAVVMIMSLSIIINYSRLEQRTVIEATTGIRNVAVIRFGEGTAKVTFESSTSFKNLVYWEKGTANKTIVPITRNENLYEALIGGLVQNKTYVINVGGKEWEFTVK